MKTKNTKEKKKLTKEEKKHIRTKQISTNTIYLPLLFIAFALIFEFANFLHLGFLDSAGDKILFPTYFLFDLAVIVLIAAFLFLLKNKWVVYSFFIFFLLLQCALNVVNATMYNIFGDILSVDLLKLGGEAATAVTPEFIDWWGAILPLLIFGAMVTAATFMMKYNKKTIEIKAFSAPYIVIAVFLMGQALGVTGFQVQQAILPEARAEQSEIESSDKYLWENFHFKSEAFKKFGTYGFYAKTIINLLSFGKPEGKELESYISFIDEGYVAENPDAPLYGDNLIVILCESVDLYTIDPIYTPTLYDMYYNAKDTYVFNNFYARNRTNISEGIVLNGSMPKNFLLQAYGEGYQYQYSLPHVFESTHPETTQTAYVHPNEVSFYNRDKSHGNEGIGFDNLLTIEDYTGDQYFEWYEWVTDLDFTSNLMDEIIPTDGTRFLSFFASLSTHGPYDFDRVNFKEHYDYYEEHFDEFKAWMDTTDFVMPTDKENLSYLRRIKAGMIDLDQTVANLINELELRGVADNTSILLFTDHNSYYHDLNYTMRGLKKSDFSSTYVNHIPAMLYSPALMTERGDSEGQIINSYCNTYDLLPTICDLYGLPSNTNMYQGYSIFSDDIDKSFFSSHLSGMFTDKLFSMNLSDVYVTDESATEDDIKNFKENAVRYYEKQKIIDEIYTNGINGKIKLPS